ncbi:LANO_0H02234g1_1 [Lachancea nothofagi CBS 11611]|uniref:LANO_0H02234g1_1 n=1 Tax=Lachancea nothofagi CBS 11611 TaxID=1266666 RepID=A0A1G4KL44_9SACH|nr:LANO_0H02234g1_1 [Lachancea nothofagi CBS 11611]
MAGQKTGYRSRKRRTARACEVCHARKVRCDAHLRMPCTSCQTFGLVCRLRVVKKSRNGQNHEEETEWVADSLTSAEGHDQEEEQTVKEVVSNGMPFGDEYLRKRGVEPGVFVDAEHRDRDRVYVYFGSSSFLSLLTGSTFPDESHFASAQKLRLTLPRSGEGSPRVANLEMLRISGAFLLPSKVICDELVDLYFQWIHPLTPVLDRTAFTKEYEANTCSIFLLQAILCVAVKVSRNPLLMDKDGSTDLASNIFYQRAKSLYDGRYEENEIALLQGMILLSKQAFHEKNLIHTPLYFIKNAIIVANTHGLHRSADFHPTLTPNEKKARKLIWWILYVLDTFASISIGRPQGINLDDCDIPVLTHDDFVFDGQAPEHATPTDYKDCIIRTVQIAEIVSRVSRELNRPMTGQCQKKTLIQHFDVLLQRWRKNLPPSLSYNSNAEIFTKHSLPKAFVNAFYYKTLCLLHKSNIHDMEAASDQQYVSAGIAFQAAHSLSLIGQILLDRNEISYCYVGHGYCFFEAMIIFVHHMYDPDSIFKEIALKCYHVLEQVLAEFGKQWNSCTLLSQVLFAFSQNPEYIRAVIARFKAKMKDQKNPNIPIEVPSPARSIDVDLQKLSPVNSGNWSSPPIQGPGLTEGKSPDIFPPLNYMRPNVYAPVQNPTMVQPTYIGGNPHMTYVPASATIPPVANYPMSYPARDLNFTTTSISHTSAPDKNFDPHQLFPDISKPLPADFHFNNNLDTDSRLQSESPLPPLVNEHQPHPFISTLSERADLKSPQPQSSQASTPTIGQERAPPVHTTSVPLPPGFWDSVKVNFNFFTTQDNNTQQWPSDTQNTGSGFDFPTGEEG